MNAEPSYEELKKRVREFERAVSQHEAAEATFHRQAQVLASIQDTIVIITPEMKTIYANEPAKNLFGDRPEMFTEPCYKFFKHRDEVCDDCPVLKSLEDQSPHKAVMKSYDKNGKEIWRYHMAAPFYDRDGNATAGIEIVTDYTTERQAESALKESEVRYRALFESMNDGVAIYEAVDEGEDFVFIDFNRAGERIDNIRREAVVGRRVTEVFPGVREFGLLDVLKRVWKTGQSEHYPISEYKDERISGWRNSFIYKLPTGEVVAIYSDETERKRAEEALRESEAKYKRVSDHSPAVLYQFLMTPSGEISFPYVSDIVESIFNISPEEVIKDPSKLLDLVHPDDQEMLNEGIKRAAETLESFPLEFRCIIDGEVIWVEARGMPTPLTDGNILWDGFLLEVTDRKQAEDALRESRERFKNTVEMLPEAVFEADPDLNFTFANKRTLEITGYTQQDFGKGLNCLDLIAPEDRERAKENAAKRIKGTKIGMVEYTGIRKDGSEYPLLLNSDPIVKEGNVIGFRAIAMDITERKKTEEKLKRSKERLDATGRMAKVGGWEFDAETSEIRWTKETLRIHEVPLDYKPTLDKVIEFFHPDDRPILLKSFQRALDEGRPYDMEARFTTAKGKQLWTRTKCQPEVVDGKVVTLKGTFQDITEQKRTEDALRESEDFLNRTGDMAKVGGWEMDLNTMKVIWTRTTGRIHDLPDGYFPDLEEAISYYHPEDQDHVRQCVQRAIESSEPFDFTVRLITAKGRERWVRALGQPIFDSGSCVRLSGTFQDVTERLKLEEELRQSQKMEAIGTLAGGIAHEFNNVLGIIMGNAELALDEVPDWNPAKDSLEEIRKASFRAKEVVRQILSFARKTMTALNPLEINTVVKESLKLMRASIPTMIDIQPNIPSEPKTILGDPTEIHQITINLCTNAAHAMKASGGTLEVGISEVTLDKNTTSRYEDLSSGDFVKLTVKDSGEGISPDNLEKVFEPYFTTKEFGAGSGMGLAVVHGLVKKCKGAINITSTVGEGTTVDVLFPKIAEEVQAKEKKEGGLPKGNERILLVDDDPSIAKMLRKILEYLGYRIWDMTDSTAALEQFKSTPDDFDLVITDMAMPKMSGDTLAAELIKVRKDIPILLCTGHSDTIDEKKAKQIGVKEFAMKPLDTGKLARAVRAALDG